jgi:hypothetical protein
MHSLVVERAIAALVATGRRGEHDLAPLSRSRFSSPARRVLEELHPEPGPDSVPAPSRNRDESMKSANGTVFSAAVDCIATR